MKIIKAIENNKSLFDSMCMHMCMCGVVQCIVCVCMRKNCASVVVYVSRGICETNNCVGTLFKIIPVFKYFACYAALSKLIQKKNSSKR